MFIAWLATLLIYGWDRGFDRIDPLAWLLLVPLFFEGSGRVTVFVRPNGEEGG